MLALPKELHRKIVDFCFDGQTKILPCGSNNDMRHDYLNNNIIKWQVKRKDYTNDVVRILENEPFYDVIKECDTVMNCLKCIRDLCLVNHGFYNAFRHCLPELDFIKQYLDVIKQDLDRQMEVALLLSRQRLRPCCQVSRNITYLSLYTENKPVFDYLDRFTDVWKTVLPKYLYQALKIPDYIAAILAKDYAAPPHEEYYCMLLFFMLRSALQRTNNSLYITTDYMLNTDSSSIIHYILDISVCAVGYDEYTNEYTYVICKKNRTDGWFFKKNSNDTCVIS
ncbi:hypothetical protein EKK58_04565 [Candidatus Dependentiae bacterium]|nr:MAG: hypothetical protein EKK58_04565 [Candidatus Dependentiae bacterium]